VGVARRYPVATFFLAAYALTWAVWVPRALAHQGLLTWRWPATLGRAWSYGPALAAVAVATATAGRPGLRRLGRALGRWRIGWRWWAVVLLGPFVVSWGAMLAHQRLTGLPARWPVARPAELLVFPLLILIVALTDGLGEEVGWRGYALPGLQARLGPAAASALLGVVWAAWHLPLFWTRGAPLEGRPFPLLLLALVPTAVLFTWVFNHTGGSVLAAVLLHATHNLAGPVLPRGAEGVFTPFLLTVACKWALALAALLADPRLRRRAGRAAQPDAASRSV
jgi:membrane protease YdiL (CAAX protease family)